jgi:putative transposase
MEPSFQLENQENMPITTIKDQKKLYFMTFATVQWVDVFTRAEYCDIVVDSMNYCIKEKGLVVYGWCLMSNHLHILARSLENDLSGVMRDLKKFTAKKIFKAIEENPQESRKGWMKWIFKKAGEENKNNEIIQLWQQTLYPIELWNIDFIQQKLNYIHQNPVKARIVTNAESYYWSSAIDYSGGKGLVEIEFI